jgi:hypothetical protein
MLRCNKARRPRKPEPEEPVMATKKSAPKSADKALDQMTDTAADAIAAFTDPAAFADAARDQYETALKSFNDGAEKIRLQTEETMTTARESFETASERLRAVSVDAMTAAREEMTEAVDFANELAKAKSITDALEIQRDYWTRLFETRVERARAMHEASVEATRDAFEPFNRSFTTAFSFTPAFDKFFPFGAK